MVVHSGGMQGGHYIAYIKHRTTSKTKPNLESAETEQKVRVLGELSTSLVSPASSSMDGGVEHTLESNGGCCVGQPGVGEEKLGSEDGFARKEFDLSPTGGQWYHTSDSHVKMVSPEEVKKSQAYVLFYEQLPLQQC